jgi:hypothetical protein
VHPWLVYICLLVGALVVFKVGIISLQHAEQIEPSKFTLAADRQCPAHLCHLVMYIMSTVWLASLIWLFALACSIQHISV